MIDRTGDTLCSESLKKVQEGKSVDAGCWEGQEEHGYRIWKNLVFGCGEGK